MLLFAGYCAVAALILFVPGWLIAWATGLRTLLAVAIAPTLSIAVIAAGAIVLDKLHIPFGLAPLGVLTLIGIAAGAVWRLAWRCRTPRWAGQDNQRLPLRDYLWMAGTWAGAALLTLRYLRHIIPRSDSVSQGYDNIFHSNAVQWAVQHRDASSLAIEAMTSGPKAPIFYPAAWHGYVASVLTVLPHRDVTIAVNATTFVLLAVAWPLALIALVRVLLPRSRAAMVGIIFLCLAFPTFPLKPLQWGPLFPNILAMILTLPIVAVLVAACDVGYGGIRVTLPTGALIGCVGAVAVALAHPNGLPVLLMFAVAILASWWHRVRAAAPEEVWYRAAPGRLAALVLSLLGLAVLWIYARPAYDNWPALSPGNWDLAAMSFVDLAGADYRAASVILGALVLLGAWTAIRRRMLRWWVLLHAAFGLLFCVNFVTERTRLRYWITGIWYCDHVRLAALFVLTGAPLAAFGLARLAEMAAPRWRLLRNRFVARGNQEGRWWLRRPVASLAAGGIGLAIIGIGTLQAGGFAITARDAMLQYSTTYNGDVLDDNEREVLRQLPQYVPMSDVIATNPWNGSSMAYALTGIRTTTTHVLYTATPDVALINEHLRDASSDPAVCSALQRLDVRWALSFDAHEVHGGYNPMPGFLKLEDAPGFVPVFSVGQAVLYRIDACH